MEDHKVTFLEWILSKLREKTNSEEEEFEPLPLRVELPVNKPEPQAPSADKKEEKRVIIIDL